MDRRQFQILIICSFGLIVGGLGRVWSQEPNGPRRPPVPLGVLRGDGSTGAHFGPAQEGRRRLEQVPPEERETFNRNLKIWHDLPPEERDVLRNEVRTQVRAEVDKAVQDSGLHLDADQREMFALRYRQERRKLERDLQRQTAVERARRMPEILGRLKTEFGGAPANSPAGKAEGSPAAEARPSISPGTGASPAAR